jgi:hypothetical protein
MLDCVTLISFQDGKGIRVRFFTIKASRIGIMGVGMAAMLSGCALGIHPGDNSPSVSYTVPRSFQMVFLRAQNQAQECLRGKGEYKVHARVDPATQSGVVSVQGPLANEVARTDFKAADEKHTQVTQTVWGHSPWDVNALDAMRESVRLDTSVCFAYK